MIPEDGSLDGLLREVEQQRERPIFLWPWPLTAEISGLWVPARSSDHIFYREQAVELEKIGIVCHELGHMLLGHVPQEDALEQLFKGMYDRVDPKIVFKQLFGETMDPLTLALARHGYEDAPEAEAEHLGTRLSVALATASRKPSELVGRRLR